MSGIIEPLQRIKLLAQTIKQQLPFNQQEVKKELNQIIDLDIDVVKLLEQKKNRQELIDYCKTVLGDVKTALKELSDFRRSEEIKKIMEEIILIENLEIAKEINLEKFEERFGSEVKDKFIALLNANVITKQEYDVFLSEIRGKVASKQYKQIEKKLRKKLEEEQFESPGPIYRDKDLDYLQQKIVAFFRTPEGREFPKNEKILFYLFGSLVNGFCNNPTKQKYGRPSDEDRNSDVDILIIISRDFFETLFGGFPMLIKKVYNSTRTLPFGLHTTYGPAYTGPFKNLFSDLSSIYFAGRSNREVTITFMEEKFFLELNLRKEPHIKIIEIET